MNAYILPVLVVGTPLYECWLDDAGTLQLEPRNHIVLAWHRPTEAKSRAPAMAVHVVHESGLAEFIAKADQLYDFVAGLESEVSSAIAVAETRERDAARGRT